MKYEMDTVRLEASVKKIDTKISEIETDKELLGNIVNKIKANWSGAAFLEFEKSITKERKQLECLLQQLKQLQEYHMTAIDQYEKCEKRISGWLKEI